jgi:hypothetical protein
MTEATADAVIIAGSEVVTAIVGTRGALAPTSTSVHQHKTRRACRVAMAGGDPPRSPAMAFVVFAFVLAAFAVWSSAHAAP